MKIKGSCPYEDKVTANRAKGIQDRDLDKHLEQCPQCRQFLEFQEMITLFSQQSIARHEASLNLPSADEIWEGAKASRKTDKELVKKAMAPLLVPQILTLVLAALAIFKFIIPNMGRFGNFISLHGESFQFLESFASIIPKLFHSLGYIMIPMALFLSFMVIFFLFSLIKSKFTISHS